jgi:DNA-binding transcriptional MerR regulator
VNRPALLLAMKNIYLLKDLARISGLSTHTVKFYLRIGLLKEFGRSPETNFRYFDDGCIKTIKKIKLLQGQDKTLNEIKALFMKK